MSGTFVWVRVRICIPQLQTDAPERRKPLTPEMKFIYEIHMLVLSNTHNFFCIFSKYKKNLTYR